MKSAAEIDEIRVPRGVLVAAAAIIALTIALATSARWTGAGTVSTEGDASAPVVASRSLLFTDLPDGGIRLTDPSVPETVAVLPPGGDNFVRGVLRALVRERRSLEIGREMPFELVLQADGRLFIDDPATGRRIDLHAFGPANSSAFEPFLGVDPAVTREALSQK